MESPGFIAAFGMLWTFAVGVIFGWAWGWWKGHGDGYKSCTELRDQWTKSDKDHIAELENQVKELSRLYTTNGPPPKYYWEPASRWLPPEEEKA